MKIKITITETKEIEIDVNLPRYLTYSNYYFKHYSEDGIVSIHYNRGISSPSIAAQSLGSIPGEWLPLLVEITENEYNDIFEAATNQLKSL